MKSIRLHISIFHGEIDSKYCNDSVKKLCRAQIKTAITNNFLLYISLEMQTIIIIIDKSLDTVGRLLL